MCLSHSITQTPQSITRIGGGVVVDFTTALLQPHETIDNNIANAVGFEGTRVNLTQPDSAHQISLPSPSALLRSISAAYRCSVDWISCSSFLTMADDEPVDPKRELEDRCKAPCTRPLKEYQPV
ncbi:hypothetical protein AAHA92_08342 [Salvia divinorum]|uniref:Uncharacterized protein n=1 Tax=Salvia divinorum TaxID=28513 RepID=A0ABD1HRX1_SALDI